jgi:hypothetical protein
MVKGGILAILLLSFGIFAGWKAHEIHIEKQAEMFFKGVESTKKK